MSNLITEATDLGTFKPQTNAFTNPGFNEGNLTAEGATESLELFISRGIGFLTILAGIFFIIYFVLGAFKWLTAGGDSGKVQKARDEMVQGVLGLVILVAAYGIVGMLGSVLGLDLLNPGRMLLEIFPSAPASTGPIII